MANDDGGDEFGPILPAGTVAAALAAAQDRAHKASGLVPREQLARRAGDGTPQMQQGNDTNDGQQQGDGVIFRDWAAI
jgi:hypothetical protein